MNVVLSPRAHRDLMRLDDFLKAKSPRAAAAAMATIFQAMTQLSRFPGAGRSADGVDPDARDWLVPYGAGGYVIRYVARGDQLIVLAIRHMREAGF